MTQYYKVIAKDGRPVNGGSGRWPLPTDTEPGDWWEVEGNIRPCSNGLHLATAVQLSTWLTSGCVVYRAEAKGRVIDAGNKVVARKVRLLPGPAEVDIVESALSVIAIEVKDPRVPVGFPPEPGYLEQVELPKGHVLYERAEQARFEYRAARNEWEERRAKADRRYRKAKDKACQQALDEAFSQGTED